MSRDTVCEMDPFISDLSPRLPVLDARGPRVSFLRQCLNFLGCLLILPFYYAITGYSRYPMTLDILISIFVAEYNRYANDLRRRKCYAVDTASLQVGKDLEKAVPTLNANYPNGPECMAMVVGYREDPELFCRALESYKAAERCRFMLVGVDGDQGPDMEMIGVFEKVFPEDSAVVQIDEPFGEKAIRYYQKIAPAEASPKERERCAEMTIAYCCRLASEILADNDLDLSDLGGINKLCLYQPHMNKKAIMFTSFIFTVVISNILSIEFLWSSDSDSIVFSDTLRNTIETIAGDPNAGGSSAGLMVHNASESMTTRLGSAVYWCELYLTRSASASSGTSDCQSGPSTAFRISALPSILYPWYTQTVLGQRMVVNEDRHLTTNLLLRGWTVTYVSDTLAATDTPTTLSRWIMQQIRWGRATHIETLQQPKIYLLNHPVFFWAAFKRQIGPLLAFLCIVYYLVTGRKLAYFSYHDVLLRLLYTILYNMMRNPHRWSRQSWLWIPPAILFYNVPLPVIHLWSLLTIMESGWGTSMRSNSEITKRQQFWKRVKDLGFFVVWMGVVGGVAARLVAGLAGWDAGATMRVMVMGMILPSAVSFYGLIMQQ